MVCIVSHNDLDGICSAAIVKRFLDKRGEKNTILITDYNNIVQTLGQAGQQNLFFLDLYISQGVDKAMKIMNRIALKNSILIFDHHSWNVKADIAMRRVCKKIVIDESKCTSEILHEHLSPGDPISEKLARFARDVDFNVYENDEAVKLNDVVSAKARSENFLMKIISMLSEGVFWENGFDHIRERFVKRKEIEKTKLLSRTKLFRINNHKVAIGFSSDILSTADAGRFLLDQTGAEVSLIFYKGKVAFRRSDLSSIDVSRIAGKFEGGGHPFASGAVLKKTMDYHVFKNFRETLVDRLEDVIR